MLYDIAFLMFSIFYIPTLVFKGKLHKDFLERFGLFDDAKSEALFKAKDPIWIQAVSVGEIALCRSLVSALKAEFPGRTIVLSTITRTGNDLARKLFSQDAVIIYFPLDFSAIARGVVSRIRPSLYIMVETEIWPNVLKELGRRRVPSILINGRISDRSYGKYRLVRRFLAPVLDNIASFCMQSDADAARIKILGAKTDRVTVTGNMKFDADAVTGPERKAPGKGTFGFGEDDRIFVAGSTHGGEEEAVLSVYKELIKEFPRLKLIIAPRHVERAAEVENIAKALALGSVRMSGAKPAGPERAQRGAEPLVYIIDAIGRLNDAYAIAEVVFVGGSLIPHGGQNPIEPAAFGKPVVFGPYMFNFRTAASALIEGGGALQVNGREELFKRVDLILRDRSAGEALGRNAREVISRNRGATARNIAVLKGVSNG